MFTNRDFLDYFGELEMKVRNSRDLYLEAVENVKDDRIKGSFETLYIRKTNQQNILHAIRKLLVKKIVPHSK